MRKCQVRELIEDVLTADDYAVEDPVLVEAIIRAESNYEENANRFEPGFYERYILPMSDERLRAQRPAFPIISETTERVNLAMSYGLMQIMGQVARERGFEGEWLADLYDPLTNVTYGVMHLDYLAERFGVSRPKTLAKAYNAGHPYSRYGTEYAEKVMRFYADIEKERSGK